MGAVCERAAPFRRCCDHDRARRSHPASRRTGNRTAACPRNICANARCEGGRVKQLAATQLLLQAGILAGDCAIEREIQGEDDDFRSVRLGIYHDAYRLRLVEVLGKDYPVLRKYLGDESFDGAALAYLTAHPSTFRNVRWFGRRFAEFLRST